MERLKWYEEFQAAFAYRYARRKQFKNKINKIKYGEQGKKKMAMSKIITIFLIINLVIIQLYSMWAMIIIGDLSALSSLITSIAAEIVTFLGYMVKSAIENKVGGITYETAMRELNKEAEG